MYARDPLSERYDDIAWPLLLRAIRASRTSRGIRVWIASPTAEFRHLDEGGYTRHERAFIRSCYWLVGPPWPKPTRPQAMWSLKQQIVAGPVPSMRGTRARQIRLRIWPRSQARVAPRGQAWTEDERLQSGGIGSGKERFTA